MDKRARLQKRLDNELARGERTDQRIVDNLNTRIKKADSNIQTFSDHLKPYISDYEAPEAFTGKFEHVKASDASQADTRFRLIEADDLITSHNELGGINEAYPKEWQIRDRTSQGSMQEVGDIAQKLDPPQLGSSYLAANGSPIITKDGVVVSGNGRTLALRETYKNYADNANSYKKYLIDHAKDFDIDPHEVSRMAKPVLVRELVGNDLDIEKFANDSNVSTIAEKRTSERAISDAEAISPQMLNTYSNDHDWDNFKMQFLANLPGNEAASLKQANGSLNKTGEVRLINALIGKAYGRDAIVGKLTEATDDISKNVSEALARTAPDVAVFEEAARAVAGIRPELSVASDIAEAALHLDKIRGDKGTNVATDNAQVYMEGLGISPEARLWLNYFDANKGSVPKISQGINNYIQLAKQQRLEGQGSLFGDEIDRSKLDLMREALGFSEEQVQEITQSREADTQEVEVFPIKQRTGRGKNSTENADTSQTFGQPPLNDNVDRETEQDVKEQISAVRRQYEGTDQWLKAPNGKPSNLKEKQWLQVRTPNFRRWFGNWNYDGDRQVKVTDVDGASLSVDFKDTKALKKWLVNEYAGKTVQIESDGSIIGFSSKKLGDSLKRRGEAQRSAYTALEDLVRNAVYYDFEKNDGQNKHKNLSGQDVYYSAMKMGNDFYSVKFKFDVLNESLSRTYKDHKVSEITISPLVYHTQTRTNNSATYAHTRDKLEFALSDLTNGVNPETVSKSVDENGVSIHAPTKGATARDDVIDALAYVMSIHAPTKGATEKNGVPIQALLEFQSTPPRRERPQ